MFKFNPCTTFCVKRGINNVLNQRSFSSRIELKREYFQNKEERFITGQSTEISLFKYDSGIEAVKYRNDSIELTILPFQGHQIWDCKYNRTYRPSIGNNSDELYKDYHSIAMQSMFDSPQCVTNADSWDYLKTYGAYFLHCGILAMGVPTPNDNHLLHGEIPNGQFDKSYIDIDDNDIYQFVAEYIGKKQFDYNYRFISSHYVDNKNLIRTTGRIENYYHKPLAAQYLAHANFRPESDSKLYYTATCDEHKKDVTIRTEIPGHVKATKEYIDLLKDLSKNPSKHEIIDQKMIELLNTEIVMTFNNYKTISIDNVEWSVSLQKLKDNIDWKNDDGSYVIMHKPHQLPKAVRWMVVDPNIEAMGVCLPATGQPLGREKAIENNEMISVPKAENGKPGVVQFDFRHGFLNKPESDKLIKSIQKYKAKPL